MILQSSEDGHNNCCQIQISHNRVSWEHIGKKVWSNPGRTILKKRDRETGTHGKGLACLFAIKAVYCIANCKANLQATAATTVEILCGPWIKPVDVPLDLPLDMPMDCPADMPYGFALWICLWVVEG